jgi:hypothetical protein
MVERQAGRATCSHDDLVGSAHPTSLSKQEANGIAAKKHKERKKNSRAGITMVKNPTIFAPLCGHILLCS